MWGELFRDGSLLEIAQMLLLVAGISFILMTPFVWIGGRTLGLKERPDRRALWTTGVAYIGAALIFIFAGGDLISPWLGPIVPLPAAILIYFWLRRTYRRGWLEDDKVPDGTILENNDWRVGVGIVVAAVVAAAIKVALRQ